jgi:hypothetical protein
MAGRADPAVAVRRLATAPTSGLPAGLPVSGAPITGLPVSGLPVASAPTSGQPAFGPPVPRSPMTGPPVVGRQPPGPPGGRSTAATVKYHSDLFPQRPCDKADLGPLATTFEVESTTPFETKNVSTLVNTFTCTHTRNHLVGGIPTDTMSATFFASVYTEPTMAGNAHKTNQENGKLAGSPVPVAGVGQDAFIYRSNQTNQPNYAMYVLDARDDNLVWELRVTITRPTAWSEQDLTRIKDQTIAAAKASFGKLTAR